MSAPDLAGDFPVDVRERPLLVIIDPAARQTDGESVRIAKDVLCAGAQAKICLPDGPEEVARALARRGSRRPVVVGDDRALLHVVRLLHRQRELADTPLSMVPVGTAASVGLARSLGVPTGAVAAARTVLDGRERRLDLLADDSDGVVLGGLRIPSGGGEHGTYGGYEPYAPYETHETREAHEPCGEARAAHGAGEEADAAGEAYGSVRGEPGTAGGRGEPGAAPGSGTPCSSEFEGAEGFERAEGSGGSGGSGGPGGSGGSGRSGREGSTESDGPSGALEPAASLGSDRHHPWWTPAARTARTALALLTLPVPGLGGGSQRGRRVQPPALRLRLEADGALLVDLDRPVRRISVSAPGGGLAEIVVHAHGADTPLHARARTVTVSGPDFRYRADALVGGPVRTRTWTVMADAWRLLLPHA
ncbi:diacylglycerol kinase family protein [Streptomyces sp. XD-27]|uniref:diacylglycerol kinase family protein n=1 Tax=Streptomyces sp. XD-27 TaxID=3062779 RepID=UPI0026F4385B|nr:diacylglycerol kinase family protein [Streptomyces sp. XD-27]WKX71246.1 diacylglycerol kinase family protein [Streptomyces sp. XD-27]